MTGKKAVIVASSGGSYADSPVDTMHVGYLRQVLAFIGVTEIEVVRASDLAIGAEVRAHSIAKAKGQIRELFDRQAA